MNKNRIVMAFIGFLLVAPCSVAADGSEWGDLRGRFVFDGVPAERHQLPVDKDKNLFPLPILDESLLVNRENWGLANVVLYLLPSQKTPLNIHPTYVGELKSKVDFVMQGGRFEPHILLLRTTQTMVQRNLDSVIHNAQIDFLNNSPK